MTTVSILNIILLVVSVFGSLIGASVFIAALINLGKLVKIGTWVLIPDGAAPNWSAGLNLIVFIGIVGYLIYRLATVPGQIDPTAELGQIDIWLKGVATVLMFIIGYVAQLKTSQTTNTVLQNVPALTSTIGFSQPKD